MIKNIINENLDQFGLPYGEGQRITPQNFVPTMPMRDPNYGIPAAADQMVFRPNTLYDSKIKNMYEMEKMGFPQKNLQDMKERDVEQFNKGKGPLSLPKDEYKGIKGYTAMAIDPNRMTDAYFGFFNTNPTTNRNFDRDFSQLPSYGDAVSGTNVQGMDLEMDPGAFINPNIQPSQNMFQRAGNAIQSGLGSIRDFAVDKGMSAKNLLGSGAAMAMGLPGIVGSGVMSLLGAFRGNPEQRARNEYNKQFSTGDIYGYGMGSASGANKDAFGYNTVSAFGNYEQHMKDKVEELEDLLEKTGRTGFKPGTYQFNILKDYTKNINKIQEDNRTRKEEEQIALANALARAQEEINRMGYQDYGSGGASAATQASYEGADGSYAGASTQDYGSGEKDGGIIGYQNGGLASMFVRRG